MNSNFRTSTFLAVCAAALAAAAPEAWAQGTGNGLIGEHYNTNDHTGAVIATTVNQGLNFDYTNTSPIPGTINVDNFSTRWRGEIEAVFSELYTFTVNVDDQARLVVNGVQLMNGGSTTATFTMVAGTHYDIMVEHREFGGNASCRVRWSSPSTPIEDIPLIRLYSPAAVPAAPTINLNGGTTTTGITLSAAAGAIYFTTDGTDPGISHPSATSTLYTVPFSVSTTAKVRARAYVTGVASPLLTSAAFLPLIASTAQPPNTSSGLYVREYVNTWGNLLPNFTPLIPRVRDSITVPTITVPPAPVRANNDNFGYQLTGYINVPDTGLWTFYTASDDGSKLYIDGAEIVDNDGSHGVVEQPNPTAVNANLQAGYHPFRVTYSQGAGGLGLEARWLGPVGSSVPTKVQIPASAYVTENLVATPVFAPAGGPFVGSQVVTITSSTPGAVIYYTTDGTNPDLFNSNGIMLSGGSVTLTATATLRAIAVVGGYNTSRYTAQTLFTRTDLVPPAPVSASASGINTQVLVSFNRPVSSATASDPANYSVDNGITVSAATLLPRTGILAGRWSFDNAAALGEDTSGNGNTATTITATRDTTTALPFANYINPASANAATLSLGAGTDTFTAPDSATLDLGLGSFTISAWVRPTDFAAQRTIVSKWTDNTQPGWFLDVTTGGALQFRMRTPNNDDTITSGGGIVAAGVWSHVAVRVDKSLCRMTIFRNGVQVQGPQDFGTASSIVDNAAVLGIGTAHTLPTAAAFLGNLDDVRIYRVLLSSAEIAALAATADSLATSVRLTTTPALAIATNYTATVRNVQDYLGGQIPGGGVTIPFVYANPGNIVLERYDNIGGGTNVTDLTRNAVFPGSPSLLVTLSDFNWDDPADPNNYGSRARGYFIPPTPGPNTYYFAIATDDQGKLFVSTDEDPANKIAVSFTNPWVNSKQFADPGVIQSGPISLVGGQKYYIETLQKEGGGGDHVTVAVSTTTPIANGANTIGAVANLTFPSSTLAPLTEPVVITTQPISRVAQAGASVSFTVVASGTGPLTYQWKKGGVNVGTNSATLTINPATQADSGDYSVVIQGGLNSATSATATLLVQDLSAPPVAGTLSVTAGPTAGGTVVTLTGTGFTSGFTTITVGGLTPTGITFTGTTQIDFTTPAHAAGAVDVVVTTLNGYSVKTNGFTYYAPPTISSIVPNEGKSTGGDALIINGTNFAPGALTTINFLTLGAVLPSAQTSIRLDLTSPAGPGGVTPVTVQVSTPGGSATQTFTYYPAPTITTLTPPVGKETGGDVIQVDGTNFSSATTVRFGGVLATGVTIVNPTRLTCTTPPGTGIVDVRVDTAGAQFFNLPASFQYFPAPTFVSINPNIGKTAGGDPVTIMGTNFAPGSTVRFGANLATGVVVTGTTQIDCVTPAGTGFVTLTITGAGGQQVVTAPAFTYYAPPSVLTVVPGSGKTLGGDPVHITGTNFSPGTVVKFGGVNATGVVITGTTDIDCITPAGAGTVAVSVDTAGTQTASLPASFTYYAAPTISSVAPNSGPSQGGTPVVTITGTNFASGLTTVSFGGTAATNVIFLDAQHVTCVPGAHDFGLVDVTVGTPGNQSFTLPGSYTYVGPRILTVSPDTGGVGGGQVVTITGSGFIAGSTTVILSGIAPITPTSVTPTQITFTTPAGTGVHDVTVDANGNTATLTNGYSYLSTPTILTVTPNAGPIAGGQPVTVTGTNFATGTQTAVTFGGIPATGLVYVNSTTVTCVTPAGAAPGTVNVGLSTFGGTPVVLTNGYTYYNPPSIASIIPSRGSSNGGQTVTISGANFVSGMTVVSFGGANATAVTVAPGGASLTCVTPPGAAGLASVVLRVFNMDPNATTSYTYVNPLTSVDLSLTKTPDTNTPSFGSDITFTITVTNNGGIPATGVTVSDPLPAGLAFKVAAPTQGVYSAATGVWAVGPIALGASPSIQIVATVTSTATIVNTAQVLACNEADVDSTPGNSIAGEDDQQSVTVSAGLIIQTTTLPPGTAGAFYSQPLIVSGGVPLYTWVLTSAPATLPFNFNPATGVISGTAPSTPATYTFTVMVLDSDSPPSSASQTLSITINAALGGSPVINALPAPPAGTVGVAYSTTFTATGGTPPYAWAQTAGTLPGGLTLDPLTGVLAGTPTTVQSAGFTLQATSAGGGPATQPFTINIVANPVTITTLSVPDGSLGGSYTTTLQVSGGLGPNFTWSLIGAPGWLSVSGTGRTATLSGNPPTSGLVSFTAQVSDNGQAGVTDTQALSFTILPGTAAFAITSTSLPPATINAFYTTTMTALGGSRPYTWSLSSGVLPTGVTLGSLTGTISGTPTVAGSFPITLSAVDAGLPVQSGSITLTLSVASAPTISNATALPSALSGGGYFVQLNAAGGVPPYRWSVSVGTLPGGLSISPTSGAISGSAGGGGTGFSITVTDANGATGTKAFTVGVTTVAGLTVITTALPDGTFGAPYSTTMTAAGGTAPYSWAVTAGALPSWATLDAATGAISGTPNAAGASSVTLQVTDSAGTPATASSAALTLTVLAPFTITQTSLPSGAPGVAYAQTLTTSGAAPGAVTWSVVSGALPTGLSLDSLTGTISGMPSAGTFVFKVQAQDALGRLSQRQFTMSVFPGGATVVIPGATTGSTGKSCALASVESETATGGRVMALSLFAALALLAAGRRLR